METNIFGQAIYHFSQEELMRYKKGEAIEAICMSSELAIALYIDKYFPVSQGVPNH